MHLVSAVLLLKNNTISPLSLTDFLFIYDQLTELMNDLFLLQVQSHLENSKFHLHQTQNQQVKQYLTLGSKLASSTGQGHAVQHPHTPGQPLATVPIMRNGHMPAVSDSSNPNSPVTLLTLANHDSEVSELTEKESICEL